MVHMSAIATKQTSASRIAMSAFGPVPIAAPSGKSTQAMAVIRASSLRY